MLQHLSTGVIEDGFLLPPDEKVQHYCKQNGKYRKGKKRITDGAQMCAVT